MTSTATLPDGLLNIDKPLGMTSMEVVRQVKQLTGQRHCGHGGTLDPEATGVLPVCLGQATRLMEYILEGGKEYQATLRLGVTTDTYDAVGEVIARSDPSSVTRAAFEGALEAFRGDVLQTPPMFSALKRQGRPLYELARQGIEVERQPRKVTIGHLEITSWQPPDATLLVQCSKGTYIRSLAHDIGQALGCGAHLTALRRTRSGAFRLEHAITLESLKNAGAEGLGPVLLPVDFAVLHLKPVILDGDQVRLVGNGRAVDLGPQHAADAHDGDERRAYTHDHRFLALLRFSQPQQEWTPHKVFRLESPSPYATSGTNE